MKTFALLLLCIFSLVGFAQQEKTALTLDQCIDYALENNIDLKRAKNTELIARANRFQAMMNFLPSLTARANYFFRFGTFFDQNVARQVSTTTEGSTPAVFSNLVLFNGFSNHYSLKQRTFELNSSRTGIEEAELSSKVNVLAFYLNAVLSKENLKISQQRVDLLEKQLDREEKRVSVGVGSLDAVYNLRSQLSNERLNLTNAKNTVASSLLSLTQAMQLEPGNYDVEPLVIDENDLLVNLSSFDQILAESFKVNPSLNRAASDRLAAKYSLKSAKAQLLPTLSVFGQIDSEYSSNGARNPETGEIEPNAAYETQLEYNRREFINFTLNIPIFNNYQSSTNAQVARINVLNADLNYIQAENTVTNVVQQAYLDVLNAQTTYSTAKENLEAQDSNFGFIKKRFEAGNTDFYSYLESLNNKNNAEAQLINAKYTIVLRKRILDLYKGL